MCFEYCARRGIICCWTCVEEPYTTMMRCSFFSGWPAERTGRSEPAAGLHCLHSAAGKWVSQSPTCRGRKYSQKSRKDVKTNNAVVRSVTCHWSLSVWVSDNVSDIRVVRLMLLFCVSVWCFVLDLCRASRCCLLFYSIKTSRRRKSFISGNADPANNEEKA